VQNTKINVNHEKDKNYEIRSDGVYDIAQYQTPQYSGVQNNTSASESALSAYAGPMAVTVARGRGGGG
jgi:hypothetical protein